MALATVVDEALGLLRATLSPNVVVRASYAHNLPLIPAVSGEIHQVIMNVGTNAVQAMGERGGEMTVVVDQIRVDPGGALSGALALGWYARVTVTDTGAGISRDNLARIFEPFFTTKGSAGTGLGLAVARDIMQQHHGAITVGSMPDRGTTVELFFPV